MADLVIRGGMVIDGTGAPGERKDLAIDGDRVAAIGPRLSGARTLAAGVPWDFETHPEVLVNGTPIRTDGKAQLEARPGRLVAQGNLR